MRYKFTEQNCISRIGEIHVPDLDKLVKHSELAEADLLG